MRKALAILLLLFLCSFSGAAQLDSLRFRKDGSLRILQLTDLHMNMSYGDENRQIFERIDRIVEQDKPDMIVVTGDIIYSRRSEELLQSVVDKLDSEQLPWAIVTGNHDHEHDLTLQQFARIVCKGRYCINSINENGTLADIEVPVFDKKSPAFYLYFLDSHAYAPDREISLYAWFEPEQVEWMRTRPFERMSINGSVEPSIAFFHIPIPEYELAYTLHNDSLSCGIQGEAVCCPTINTGMFQAMRSGDSVIGTFCGHDHNNDYVAAYNGIALAYGRYSGSNREYNDLIKGGRMIVIHAHSRQFETWIRDDVGRKIRFCRFDATKSVLSFPKDE